MSCTEDPIIVLSVINLRTETRLCHNKRKEVKKFKYTNENKDEVRSTNPYF